MVDKNGSDIGKAFCFCVGEIVDCLPGVVLDCNNHRRMSCPLVEEAKQKEKEEREKKDKEKREKDNRAFCFCLGAQVDCLPGVVLDCNNHRTTVCPLVAKVLSVNDEKEERVKQLREKYKKGKGSGQKKEEPVKEAAVAEKPVSVEDTKSKAAHNEKEKNKKRQEAIENTYRNFCFCMGTMVSCSTGVVLDCNNHRTQICPVLLEALPVDEEDKAMIEELKPVFDMTKL